MTNTIDRQPEVIGRDPSFPPEKVWYGLTQSHLIEKWLMKKYFKSEPGQSFTMSGD